MLYQHNGETTTINNLPANYFRQKMSNSYLEVA